MGKNWMVIIAAAMALSMGSAWAEGTQDVPCSTHSAHTASSADQSEFVVAFTVLKDGKLVRSGTIHTLDGEPAPFAAQTHLSGATVGFVLCVLPRARGDAILLDVVASQDDLDLPQGVVVRGPTVDSVKISQKVAVRSGDEAVFPMGKYALKIVTTRQRSRATRTE